MSLVVNLMILIIDSNIVLSFLKNDIIISFDLKDEFKEKYKAGNIEGK